MYDLFSSYISRGVMATVDKYNLKKTSCSFEGAEAATYDHPAEKWNMINTIYWNKQAQSEDFCPKLGDRR